MGRNKGKSGRKWRKKAGYGPAAESKAGKKGKPEKSRHSNRRFEAAIVSMMLFVLSLVVFKLLYYIVFLPRYHSEHPAKLFSVEPLMAFFQWGPGTAIGIAGLVFLAVPLLLFFWDLHKE